MRSVQILVGEMVHAGAMVAAALEMDFQVFAATAKMFVDARHAACHSGLVPSSAAAVFAGTSPHSIALHHDFDEKTNAAEMSS